MMTTVTIPESGLVVVRVQGADYDTKAAFVAQMNAAAQACGLAPRFVLCAMCAPAQLTEEQLRYAQSST